MGRQAFQELPFQVDSCFAIILQKGVVCLWFLAKAGNHRQTLAIIKAEFAEVFIFREKVPDPGFRMRKPIYEFV